MRSLSLTPERCMYNWSGLNHTGKCVMNTPVVVKCLDERFLFGFVDEDGLCHSEETGLLIENDDIYAVMPLEPGTLH